MKRPFYLAYIRQQQNTESICFYRASRERSSPHFKPEKPGILLILNHPDKLNFAKNRQCFARKLCLSDCFLFFNRVEGGCVPDITSVLVDCTVTGKAACTCNIHK